MTRTQRDALVALKRALEVCEARGVDVVGMGAVPGRTFTFGSGGGTTIEELLGSKGSEKLLGDASRRGATWEYRPWGQSAAAVRWVGEATRAWWEGPALKRDNQLKEQAGRLFRLDFITGQVYEVFV